MHRLAVLLALTIAFACVPPDPDAEGWDTTPRDLEVSNQTTLTVSLIVNGAVVRVVPPGVKDRIVVNELPPQPWSVEARSATGRVIASITVRPGDVRVNSAIQRYEGVGNRADLSCGRLDIWSGPPLFGPVPGPGSPGDCEP